MHGWLVGHIELLLPAEVTMWLPLPQCAKHGHRGLPGHFCCATSTLGAMTLSLIVIKCLRKITLWLALEWKVTMSTETLKKSSGVWILYRWSKYSSLEGGQEFHIFLQWEKQMLYLLRKKDTPHKDEKYCYILLLRSFKRIDIFYAK